MAMLLSIPTHRSLVHPSHSHRATLQLYWCFLPSDASTLNWPTYYIFSSSYRDTEVMSYFSKWLHYNLSYYPIHSSPLRGNFSSKEYSKLPVHSPHLLSLTPQGMAYDADLSPRKQQFPTRDCFWILYLFCLLEHVALFTTLGPQLYKFEPYMRKRCPWRKKVAWEFTGVTYQGEA